MATLEGLAAEVNTYATALTQLLIEANLPAPYFAPDAPPSPPHRKILKKYKPPACHRPKLLKQSEIQRLDQ